VAEANPPTALKACQTWQSGTKQIIADQLPAFQKANSQATAAAKVDPRWKDLSSAMQVATSLPTRGVTSEQVAQGTASLNTIIRDCASLGVTIEI
jgi:hypothetical protein